jgi:hypothetical protein
LGQMANGSDSAMKSPRHVTFESLLFPARAHWSDVAISVL